MLKDFCIPTELLTITESDGILENLIENHFDDINIKLDAFFNSSMWLLKTHILLEK
jgi:hypothetical protein